MKVFAGDAMHIAISNLPTLVKFAQTDRKTLGLLRLIETIGKSMAFLAQVRRPRRWQHLRQAFAATPNSAGLISATLPGEKLQVLFVDVTSSMTGDFVERFKPVTE